MIASLGGKEPGVEVHALDRATGATRWMRFMPRDARDANVIIGATAIYVTGANLRALDRVTGALLWEWAPPGRARLEQCPAISDGTLFVPTDAGLFALR